MTTKWQPKTRGGYDYCIFGELPMNGSGKMKTDEMIRELRKMADQFICPKDTFFTEVADRLEREGEIERLRKEKERSGAN